MVGGDPDPDPEIPEPRPDPEIPDPNPDAEIPDPDPEIPDPDPEPLAMIIEVSFFMNMSGINIVAIRKFYHLMHNLL